MEPMTRGPFLPNLPKPEFRPPRDFPYLKPRPWPPITSSF